MDSNEICMHIRKKKTSLTFYAKIVFQFIDLAMVRVISSVRTWVSRFLF